MGYRRLEVLSIASTTYHAVPYARTAYCTPPTTEPASFHLLAALKITRLDTLPFGLPPSLPPTATMASPHYLLQQLAADGGLVWATDQAGFSLYRYYPSPLIDPISPPCPRLHRDDSLRILPKREACMRPCWSVHSSVSLSNSIIITRPAHRQSARSHISHFDGHSIRGTGCYLAASDSYQPCRTSPP